MISLLSQLKNASLNNKESITIELNKFSISILEILYLEGFVLSYKINRKKNFLNNTVTATVFIKNLYGQPLFENLKIISSSSSVKYLSLKSINRLNPKKYTYFLSTNKGLLTLVECKKNNIGGILLFAC